jgi:BolA protein
MPGNQEGMYHLKITLSSRELKNMNRIESNKKIYKILDKELKEYIHSIQILIS